MGSRDGEKCWKPHNFTVFASFGQRNWLVGGLEHEWISFHFIKKGCHPKPIVPKSSYFSEWLKPWLLHHQPVGVGKCWDVFASNDLGENRNLDQEAWIRRDFTRLSLPWLNRNQTGDTKKTSDTRSSCVLISYPLVICYIAMENGHL